MTKKELAKEIYRISNIRGEFLLRSSQMSDEYFDKYLFEGDPKCLREIAKRAVKLIPSNARALAGLEMGGIPVATMISHFSGLQCLFVRKEAKEYGTCKYAEGGSIYGKTLVIIEDVVTSGGAILDAVEKLRKDGATVKDVICVIDRQSGGLERLKESGLTLRSLFTKSELERSAQGMEKRH
jgi:orotate phosphoribosyltransferase